jgi:hypothetical protein
MKDRPVGLLELAMTRHTLELPPRLTAGMPIGTDVATSRPAGIGTVRARTKLLLGVDGALASARGGDQRWWGTRGLRRGISRLFPGSTEWLVEEARKGFGVFGALAWWRGRCRWCWARCRSCIWPQHMEQEAQPEKRDQEKCIEHRGGCHDEALSHGGERGPSYPIFGLSYYPFAEAT